MSKAKQAKRIISAVILTVIMLIIVIFTANENQNNQYQNNTELKNENLLNPNLSTGESETEPEIPITGEIHTDKDNADNNTGDNKDNKTDDTDKPAAIKIPNYANPPVKAGRIYQDKFDSLRAKYNNDDIIGIIKIPDTVVYYPVAYNAQDTNYYLNRNLYKNLSAAGSICLDYENSIERYDPNTILYGHQMYSNSMFHTLNYYRNEDYFNSHRYIIFNTIYEENVWEVFTFFEAQVAFDHAEYINYIKVFFRSEQNFLDLAAEMKKRSLYETEIEIKEGDRILTLSTCTNLDPDTRYVLSARMIKNKDDIPEEIAAQMSGAVEDFQ